jgi:hypothetical protein
MTHKHFTLTLVNDGVSVNDPRWPDKPVYVAASLKQARRWVDAYRDGQQWAVEARL